MRPATFFSKFVSSTAAAAVACVLLLAPPAQAEEQMTDDELLYLTAIVWAGYNCGKTISLEDLMAALDRATSAGRERADAAMQEMRYRSKGGDA